MAQSLASAHAAAASIAPGILMPSPASKPDMAFLAWNRSLLLRQGSIVVRNRRGGARQWSRARPSVSAFARAAALQTEDNYHKLRKSKAATSERAPHRPKVADLNDIVSERGACGVGFIANLRNEVSHKIIEDALIALGCMEHRGGCGADNDSGDGAGLMTCVPWDLYNNWANTRGLLTLDKHKTGVGMLFLPRDDKDMKEAKESWWSRT